MCKMIEKIILFLRKSLVQSRMELIKIMGLIKSPPSNYNVRKSVDPKLLC